MVVALCALAGVARAEDGAAAALVTRPPPAPARHAIYLDALGKGGLWAVGYDYQLGPWLGGGAALSFVVLDGQRVTSVSPYLAIHPLGRDRHRWFVHAGPQLVHVATPSPVPEWSGDSSTGLGAEVSSGYEYRRGLLVRLYGMVAVGRGGAAPWLGASVGWTL
jgi:hypothetical protein